MIRPESYPKVGEPFSSALEVLYSNAESSLDTNV